MTPDETVTEPTARLLHKQIAETCELVTENVEATDSKLSLWRDYFDLTRLKEQLAPATGASI